MDTVIPQTTVEKPTRAFALAVTIVLFILIATLFVYRYSKSVISFGGGSISAAQAYYNIDYSGEKPFFGPQRERYIPTIYKTYAPQDTTNQTGSVYYYYTTESADTYNDTVEGYVPAGCEGGTDYSTITGEPCG